MIPHNTSLYPLRFQPIYKKKVWGGRNLQHLGRTLPGGEQDLIGESWELADLSETSPSGGGGGAERSAIANGPLAGQTLHQLIEHFGERLLGRLKLSPTGDFPLLVKYLDAQENLSLQVHPSPQYARQHPDAHLKSEAWYIVDAEPDAVIYKGIQENVTPQALRGAVEANDENALLDMLIAVPVKAGDCHFLPSGTCHALGAGILVAEVQTPSDTTFRVYDWGRTSRELHLDQAMQCIDFAPPNVAQAEKRTHIAGMFTTVSRLVHCDHFRIEKIRMTESYQQEIPYDQPAVWMVLAGKGTIDPHNDVPPVEFSRGQTLLIPANMRDATVQLHEDTVWLEVTFPQTKTDLLA